MDGLVAVLALTMAGEAATPETDTHSVLPIVPGAVDVVRSRGQGPASVQYDVRESYPAPNTIGYLVDAMSKRGWKLIQFGAFKPEVGIFVPSQSSLSDLRRLSAMAGRTHVWDAWWRDGQGRGVAFHLEYSCPMEQQGLHSVWVHVRGSIYGPKEAVRQEAERKRVREEFCQSARDSGLPPDPTCAN